MIRVLFDPEALAEPDRTWWAEWQAKAQDATDEAIESFEEWLSGDQEKPFKCKFNQGIWRELKTWLLRNVFFRKCAYCERIISGFTGDAEHYRPKGAVTCDNATHDDFVTPSCEFKNPATGEQYAGDHPGYFWLAYDWRNLVPACKFCNSGKGKNERFDIANEYVVLVKLDAADIQALRPKVRPRASKLWPDYYYPSPSMLDEREQPLLLNPLNALDHRDPRKHLRFGVRGTVAARTTEGSANIRVFRLDKDDADLLVDRSAAQERFRSDYYLALRESTAKAEDLLDQYAAARFPFSAAALDYHKIFSEDAPKPR